MTICTTAGLQTIFLSLFCKGEITSEVKKLAGLQGAPCTAEKWSLRGSSGRSRSSATRLETRDSPAPESMSALAFRV